MKVKVQSSLALWLGGASDSWGCGVDWPDSEWQKILRGGGGSLEPIGTFLDSWRKGQIQVVLCRGPQPRGRRLVPVHGLLGTGPYGRR